MTAGQLSLLLTTLGLGAALTRGRRQRRIRDARSLLLIVVVYTAPGLLVALAQEKAQQIMEWVVPMISSIIASASTSG